MNAQDNWDDLRYFLAVARHGSLSAAARVLGVNHSTVLRRVAALETALGVQLFDKQPGGYVLTAAGDELHQTAVKLEEDIAAASRQLSGRDARIGGVLRVTTVDILALHILPRHVAVFRDRYPGIRIDMVIAESSLSLARREADVAVRSTLAPPGYLVGRAVSGMAFAVYGAEAWMERHGIPDDPARSCWVGLDESFDHTRMARWYKKTVPSDRIGYRVNSVAALVEAAGAGLGLALLPCGLADQAPGLRRLGPPIPEVESKIWLLTHDDLRHMGRVRAFLDFMADAIATDRDLLEGRRGR